MARPPHGGSEVAPYSVDSFHLLPSQQKEPCQIKTQTSCHPLVPATHKSNKSHTAMHCQMKKQGSNLRASANSLPQEPMGFESNVLCAMETSECSGVQKRAIKNAKVCLRRAMKCNKEHNIRASLFEACSQCKHADAA
eukprot:1155968-Pelagomonas_calceolata.AAC.3